MSNKASVDALPGDLIDEYLTNGVYDPRKSETRAEDLKNLRRTVEELKAAQYQRRRKIYSDMFMLIHNIPEDVTGKPFKYILYTPKREKKAVSYDRRKHQKGLRTPSALVQNGGGINRNYKPNPRRKSYGESKLIHPYSEVVPSLK